MNSIEQIQQSIDMIEILLNSQKHSKYHQNLETDNDKNYQSLLFDKKINNINQNILQYLSQSNKINTIKTQENEQILQSYQKILKNQQIISNNNFIINQQLLNQKSQNNQQTNSYDLPNKNYQQAEFNSKNDHNDKSNKCSSKFQLQQNTNKLKQYYYKQNKGYKDNCQKLLKKIFIPQQRLYYYYKIIKILIGNFNKIGYRQILIVPFTTLSLIDSPAEYVAQNVQYNIFQELRNKNQKNAIQDGDVVCLKAKGLKFYYGLYLIKVPKKHVLKDYSEAILERTVKNIFNQLENYGDKSIVFPKIIWHGLKIKQFARSLLNKIMKNIRERQNLKLKQIIIILNDKEQYLTYANELRDISDQYVRNGPQCY